MDAGAAAAGAARQPLVDALRALALLGVLVVNAVSYAGGPYGTPLGQIEPADSPAARLVFATVAALLQGKAYPMLAFIFGYSLALALQGGGGAQRAYRRRRMARLLLLGVLHGLLLYAGDILTVYAVVGLILLAGAQLPLRLLIRCAVLLGLYALLMTAADAVTAAQAQGALVAAGTYATSPTWPAWLALNAEAYVAVLSVAWVLYLPEMLLLALVGLIAGRLRLLTRARWSALRGRMLRYAALPALVLNLGYAAFATWATTRDEVGLRTALALSPPAAWLLSTCAVLLLAQAWHRGADRMLRWIVPLGRYSLSVYVSHSALCLVCFSGWALAWRPGTAATALWAVTVWTACAWLARWAGRRRFHGPLEAWMIRP